MWRALILILAASPALAGTEFGNASWYYEGARTATGEVYQAYGPELTCAHKSLPFGTRLRVTDLDTGAAIVCRVNDRGPYISGRIVDLNGTAAKAFGLVGRGVARVRVDW
jgi:rare lipoprotein A